MAHKPVFALVDCNNFFVSCERIFQPHLNGKPVVVLSSNDGCAVARSNEAKALGIPMGAPAFKYRELFERHNVVRFSGNFELYADISRRITELLISITPRIEIYSVDESFLDLSQLPIEDYGAWAHAVRRAIWDWIGVPVSIGIAPTKTLAKLASDRSKKDPRLQGVLDLSRLGESWEAALSATPVQDVWGIGWRLNPKMRAIGIATAWQLAQLRPQRAQQLMGITGRQLITELNGTLCHPLTLEGRLPKSIARTRTFGEDTSDFNAIQAALASFATQAAFRLRRSQQLTKRAGLFLTTSKHKPGFRSWSRELLYRTPTADTGRLITDILSAFAELYNPQAAYHRGGVVLHDFVPDAFLQTDLLGQVDPEQHGKTTARLAAIDHLNERYGKRTVRYAAEDLGSVWQPRRRLRSPRYTTSFDELQNVRVVLPKHRM